MPKRASIPDPVEAVIAEALDMAGVRYTRPDPPDFYLPEFNIAIECKRLYAPRIQKVMENEPEIIVIQGMAAARTFHALVGITGRELRESTDYIIGQRKGMKLTA